MEVWGGATFDTMHRFLGEDPWMRPKILKKYITKTPFAMLIRGQNLVGYRHYADDVVRMSVDKDKELEQMGADAVCIKDMAGLLSPFDAYDLVSAIKKEIKVPLHLHSHYTSGMASMTYLKAIEAGVDVVDTCLAPFALRTSMPAIEPLVAALQGTERATGIDLHKLLLLGEHLANIAPRYNHRLAEAQ